MCKVEVKEVMVAEKINIIRKKSSTLYKDKKRDTLRKP